MSIKNLGKIANIINEGNGSTEPFLRVAQSYFCDMTSKIGSTEPAFGNNFRSEISVGRFFASALCPEFQNH
jgi:hypothetical protein